MVLNLGLEPPPEGHNITLRGREMIHRVEKKKTVLLIFCTYPVKYGIILHHFIFDMVPQPHTAFL